ncbi:MULTISPECIES: phosphomannomutase [Kitasatospora]|uniref:Putative phosphohexose mutase family protein n=1 Tax=Kitasatospora setae (strain ATCC 33774 / DSM 43861 / JCM 3304 / KCC A-0304 / NBRC 14216 / KM-6054) TaxID=452652 RepID=E4MZ36_KITSK|nr:MULTISPECIES: phosphomannomutase [Kitasatospora]BAJ25929.1 putative phosphohexose mutase family protein [Kitasatospora setae KM-6054]BAJ33349.1 putative phosphohexose mutase family protein [Kitasatospora setae KM-6054]
MPLSRPHSLDLSPLVNTHDLRGTVPDQWDERIAELFGAAFARVTKAQALVVGHDTRSCAPDLALAFAQGAALYGTAVTDIGPCTSDQLYFASGELALPGAMFTAPHGPAGYHGLTLCRAGAAPLGQDAALAEIRALVERWAVHGAPPSFVPVGTIRRRDVLGDYGARLRALAGLRGIRPLTVVVDAGDGPGRHSAPAVLAALPLRVVPLPAGPDTAPAHARADPLAPAATAALRARVVAEGADLGLALDGGRCAVVDERGESVPAPALAALLTAREMDRHPGATVVHDLATSRSVPEAAAEYGGKAVRTRVGHTFVREEMAATGAVLGTGRAGHYYFRDFWNADSGLLAALHLLAALDDRSGPLSALVAPWDRYRSCDETDIATDDPQGRTAALRAAYARHEDVMLDDLDGLTVTAHDWWFNLRPSTTRPLLRLNVEARDAATLGSVREEVLRRLRA